MTGRDAMTILVHGISTVLAGDNETMEKAKSLPCDSPNHHPATILFPMTTDSTMTLPKFEVGQVWRTRGGDTCTIILMGNDPLCSVKTNLRGFHWHDQNGHSVEAGGDHEDDLVSLVSKPVLETVPIPNVASASSTPHLPPAIANGDEPFYVVVAVDPDGEKLVWETPIPEQTTLNAALERRPRLNPRYSVSYIAECRIIPLLTQQP